MDYLTPEEREEEIRCAALGLEGPNYKSFWAEVGAEQADLARKRRKENPEIPMGRYRHPSWCECFDCVDLRIEYSKPEYRCDDPEGDWIEEQKRGAED